MRDNVEHAGEQRASEAFLKMKKQMREICLKNEGDERSSDRPAARSPD